MIILSVGMPRAGSGWYYNLTNDLMLANGAQNAHQIRQRFHLQRILTEVNCNIGALTPRRLAAVLIPSLFGNTFVIKAHSAPTPFARQIIRRGWLKPTYIYRDPRDALLSVMENGRRALERGRPNAFSPWAEFDRALDFMAEYLHIWEAWMGADINHPADKKHPVDTNHPADKRHLREQVLLVRYEDLLLNYDAEVARLGSFLDLELQQPQNQQVIERYRPEQVQTDQKGLHFSHGKIGRFRQKLNPQEQAAMRERLSPQLERMGYPI